MTRWLYLLLLAAPLTYLARAVGAPPWLVFTLAALAIIPLAGLIGASTERLAEHVGGHLGGLLNATFGNAAEIIIGLLALADGLTSVVRASITGSIIGNALLVLGSAMLAGGWKHGVQRFNRRSAADYATMLVIVVIGLSIPSLLATVGAGERPGTLKEQGLALHELSVGVALILLVCYAAYIAYSVFGVRARHAGGRGHARDVHDERHDAPRESPHGGQPPAQLSSAQDGSHTHRHPAHNKLTMERGAHHPSGFTAQVRRWWGHTIWFPVVALVGVTALTAVLSEALVGAIEPMAEQIHLNPFFVGLIILPIVGNAAEHYSAITMATHDHMETTMAITAGSSIQVALLVAPILVLASLLFPKTLDLSFTLLEIAVFGLVAGIYALISIDGESNWFEGLLLLAFYLILALGVLLIPTA